MRLIILAKAPVLGRVKTRLMPVYSAEQAAEIHKQMVEAVLRKTSLVFNDIWLAVDDVDHLFFQKMKINHTFTLCFQGHGDLGDRLKHLMKLSFEENKAKSIIFIGSDSPHVPITRYQQAVNTLLETDIVVGPVEDGGYDLIALKQPFESVFEGITWGSESVLQQTFAACEHHKKAVATLDVSFDIDRADDLMRAPPESWGL